MTAATFDYNQTSPLPIPDATILHADQYRYLTPIPAYQPRSDECQFTADVQGFTPSWLPVQRRNLMMTSELHLLPMHWTQWFQVTLLPLLWPALPSHAISHSPGWQQLVLIPAIPPAPPLDRCSPTSELWRLSGGKRGDYQNCSVLYFVLKLCTVISTLRWAVLTVLWIRFVSLGPFHCA